MNSVRAFDLKEFSAKYETIYTPVQSGEIVFKAQAAGRFEMIVNGDTLVKPARWRPIPARIPFKVEAGKEYKIEAYFSQIGNWPASLSLDFGTEVPVSFDDLIEKLKGIDLVVFAGGISALLEGEEMPVELPGFKGGDRTDIELPAIQRNCLKDSATSREKDHFCELFRLSHGFAARNRKLRGNPTGMVWRRIGRPGCRRCTLWRLQSVGKTADHLL